MNNMIPRKKDGLTVYSPFGGLLDLQRDINDLFDFSFSRWADKGLTAAGTVWNPAVDLTEEKDHITVKADLPGVKKENIEVSVHDGVLTVRGERKESEEKKEKGVYRSERFYGSFERSVALPSSADESKIKAAYKDGVLELTIPKRPESQSKRIAVE